MPDYSLSNQFPQSPDELGDALRRLRLPKSLRHLASEQPQCGFISKSQLHRYESGVLPPVELADYLSKLYGGEGWVGTAIRNLWQSTWDPWESDIPTEVHCIKWPSKLSGLVWIKFWPTPATLGKKHTILLQWGPWECILTRELPECGITLSTGKAIDEVAVVCMITTNYKVHLLHGSGTVEDAIDIRGIWSKNPRRNQIKN